MKINNQVQKYVDSFVEKKHLTSKVRFIQCIHLENEKRTDKENKEKEKKCRLPIILGSCL